VARRVDYDERQYAVYSAGRALTPTMAALWVDVFARYLDKDSRREIVDVGCGTGMYSRLLAEAFDAAVTGVDPSERMREVAERENPHPHVRYVAGAAERVPLADGSCDAALMSNVIHHVEDREACASELARVLRPRGLLLVRGTLGEDVPRIPFFEFFPSALPVDLARIPSADEVVEIFAGRFGTGARETIMQESAPSLRTYYKRVRTRAISTLELIDDAEFAEGVARMGAAADAEVEPAPVIEPVSLLVLRRI
jgi:ubiquinone/menaquinone biosynthesis C-methylase UbiE